MQFVAADKAGFPHEGIHLRTALFKGVGHGITVAELCLQGLTIKVENTQVERELAGKGILHSDAQGGAVPLHADLVGDGMDGLL